MSDDLREKLWASTEWWHNDCELKRAVCDDLATKDAEIKALREQRDELTRALEKMVGLFEPGRVYDFKEVSALSSEALHIALAAIAKAKGE